jgi:hypothetical protein
MDHGDGIAIEGKRNSQASVSTISKWASSVTLGICDGRPTGIPSRGSHDCGLGPGIHTMCHLTVRSPATKTFRRLKGVQGFAVGDRNPDLLGEYR